MIVCDAKGGLNNRIRCLISTMRISKEIKLIWTVKESNVGAAVDFDSYTATILDTSGTLSEISLSSTLNP